MLSFQEKTCEETASFDLTSFDIASCIEDIAQCIEFIECREHNELQDTNEAAGIRSTSVFQQLLDTVYTVYGHLDCL